jgi:hypothetical protein
MISIDIGCERDDVELTNANAFSGRNSEGYVVQNFGASLGERMYMRNQNSNKSDNAPMNNGR